MRVTVRLFAQLRDAAGRSETTCDVTGGTVADVWRVMQTTFPALAPFRATVSCAVNADFARMQSAVKDGDDVAFLPPVSGG